MTLMAMHECVAMRDVEKYMGRTLVRETVPGFEPAIPPIQPKDHPVARPTSRLRPRRGFARRR